MVFVLYLGVVCLFICLFFLTSVYAESYGNNQQTEEMSNNSHHREVQKNLTDKKKKKKINKQPRRNTRKMVSGGVFSLYFL